MEKLKKRRGEVSRSVQRKETLKGVCMVERMRQRK